MRVIAYARVSTDEQATDGLSLAAQLDRMRAYCLAHDHDLVDAVAEAGSGATVRDRPKLTAALGMLEAGAADGLLVVKLDRLTRSIVDFARLLERVPALLSVKDNLDTSSASGRLVTNVMLSVSQWEREIIGERTREALAFKRERGERLGRPPVGWTVEDGELVPSDRYPIVERAHHLRDHQGFTPQQIADVFNGDCIATGSGSGQWHRESIRRLLKSPLVGSV